MNEREPSIISSWWVGWRLSRYLPKRYLFGGALWVIVISFPILTGLLLRALFDRFSQGTEASVGEIAWLLVAFVALDVVRQALFWLAIASWPQWWNSVQTVLRTNVLRSILCARGPAAARLPASSGEALNRFRDDVEDILLLVDIWIDLTGDAVFAAIALAIMYRIDSSVTIVVALPMVVIIVVTRALSDRIKATHSAARAAAANVSEQLGGLFGGVLSLKVAGAEKAAIARLREHNAVRRDLEVKARLLTDLLDTLTASSVSLSTGLVLLLVAPAMRSGRFTVGDLALFTAYVGWLAGLPRRVGRTLYRLRQTSVASGRLVRLLAEHEDERDLVAHNPVYFRERAPAAPAPPPVDEPFARLEVEGITARHPSTGRGVVDVSFEVERGELVVVTGAVGAGKTTLLRAILGLLPIESGTMRWNGVTIADAGVELVPPRAAYAAQVPRLWSASLRENLRLGWAATDDDLDDALRLARLSDDVGEMADRLDTLGRSARRSPVGRPAPACTGGPRAGAATGAARRRRRVVRARRRDRARVVGRAHVERSSRPAGGAARGVAPPGRARAGRSGGRARRRSHPGAQRP